MTKQTPVETEESRARALPEDAVRRRRAARAELASEMADIGIWEWEVDTGLVDVNRAFLRMIGADDEPRAFNLQRWRELLHPEDRERVAAEVDAALASDGAFRTEYRRRTLSGDWRQVMAWGRVLDRDAAGRPLRMIGIDTDVTELRRTEAELQRARDWLELALDGGELGLYEVDLVSGNAVVDERYLRQIGLSGADAPFTLQRWRQLLNQDDADALAGLIEDLNSGCCEHADVEYRMRHASGGWRWILDRSRVCERDAVGHVVRVAGAHIDITERKAAEAALAELNRTLEQRVAEQTAELRGQAAQLRALASQLHSTEQRERKRLATILHDHIQQLIVAAQLQVKALMRGDDAAKWRVATEGLDALLREALEASRSLTVELSPPVLQESGLIGGLNWLASRVRERQGLAVRLSADPAAEPADAEMRFLLFECVRELLLNIVKHAGCEQADVTLLRRACGEIRCVVSDSGRGFDVDALQRLAPEEMTFGLFSIRERVAYIGGRMEVESAPARGTEVTIAVPGELASAAGAMAEQHTTGQAFETVKISRRGKRRRLLIVDDHQILREGLAGLLQIEPDIDIVGEAATGEEAVARAAELRPDVIIMDINLGRGIDGIEATRRVLAADPRAVVIGLSMHADPQVADAMRAAGAADYVTKGGSPDELVSAIRRHAQAAATGPEGEDRS